MPSMSDFRRFALAVTTLSLILALGIFAVSCGDETTTSGDESDGTDVPANPVVVERPEPGTVRVLDGLKDQIDLTGGQVASPAYIDITTVTILRNAEGIKFIMDLNGELPDVSVEGSVGTQWAYNLDTDMDGLRDWSVTTVLQPVEGWRVLLFNHQTGETLSGVQFPGSFLHPRNSIEITLKPEAIGSPELFKWSVLAEEVSIARDVLPQDAWPVAEGWLDYP